MDGPKSVVLIGSAYPLRGGLSAFNERIIREYRNSGYHASICTFSLQYPGFLFPGKTQFSTDPPPEDLRIEVLVNSINPFNWIRVGWKLRKQRPDLVIVKFWIPFMAPCFGTICRIIKSNRHTRVISIIDNIIPHEHRPGDRILAKYWVNSADGFVTMSKNVLQDLRRFTSSKPALFCPHPIYDNYGQQIDRVEALKKLGLPGEYRYVLFFGFIRDYKGLDLLLKAFSLPGVAELNIRLIVAGEFYSDSSSYFSLISDLHLEDRVIMRNDFIPESEVANYFCASSLVVQPYKSATQSGVTQIAYHFNKPMIITRVGGLEEFVPDQKVGYVVEPDPAAIAEAMIKYFKEGREDIFVQNVMEEKKRFSWTRMLETIKKLSEV